jgi:hypothetical protein
LPKTATLKELVAAIDACTEASERR